MKLGIKVLILLPFLLVACNSVDTNKNTSLNFNVDRAGELFKGATNILLLPCVGCGCFKEALPEAYKKDSAAFKGVTIFSDTSCTDFSFKYDHIAQKDLDNLSEDFYNIILLKYENDNYVSRILDSKESHKIAAICKVFFAVH